MGDSIHDFTLHGTIYFKISDPKILTDYIDDDPIGKIKQEIMDRFTKYLKNKRWETILDLNSFLVIKNELLSEQSWHVVFDFAFGLGVHINAIDIYRNIPEKYVEDKIKIENSGRQRIVTQITYEDKEIETELQHKLELKKKIHESTILNISRYDGAKEQIVQATIDAYRKSIGNVADDVTTSESFEKAVASVQRAMKTVAISSSFREEDKNDLLEYNKVSPKDMLPSQNNSSTILSENQISCIIDNIINGIIVMSCSSKDKKELLKYIRQVKSQIELGDDKSTEIILTYWTSFKNYFVTLSKYSSHELAMLVKDLHSKLKHNVNMESEVSDSELN